MASGLQLILRLQLILVLQSPQTLTLGETTVNLDTIVGFHFARILVISRGHLLSSLSRRYGYQTAQYKDI